MEQLPPTATMDAVTDTDEPVTPEERLGYQTAEAFWEAASTDPLPADIVKMLNHGEAVEDDEIVAELMAFIFLFGCKAELSVSELHRLVGNAGLAMRGTVADACKAAAIRGWIRPSDRPETYRLTQYGYEAGMYSIKDFAADFGWSSAATHLVV